MLLTLIATRSHAGRCFVLGDHVFAGLSPARARSSYRLEDRGRIHGEPGANANDLLTIELSDRMSRSSNKHLKSNTKRLEPTMRKISESTFVSLDGVTEDPRAWAMGYFNENAHKQPSNSCKPATGC